MKKILLLSLMVLLLQTGYSVAQESSVLSVEGMLTQEEIGGGYSGRATTLKFPANMLSFEGSIATLDLGALGGGDLSETDINTLSKLNTILTDATLVDSALTATDINTREKLNAIFEDMTVLDLSDFGDSSDLGINTGATYTNFGSLSDASINALFAAIDTSWAVGGGDLTEADINTLSKLNAIVADATLVNDANGHLGDLSTSTPVADALWGRNALNEPAWVTSLSLDNSEPQFHDETDDTKQIKIDPSGQATDTTYTIGTDTSGWNFGINRLYTAGEVQGKIDVQAEAGPTKTILLVEALGTIHLATAENTLTITSTTAADGTGYNFIVYVSGAGAVLIKPHADDKFRFNGVLQDAGIGIAVPASSEGHYATFVLTDYATDVAHWTVFGATSAWAEEEVAP